MIVKPDFDGRSIYNLSQSITAFFGGKPEGKELAFEIPENEGLALFLFDALGATTLEKVGPANHPHEEITSVFPSTTATVLTTLFTGRAPAEHGVIGFMTFVKEAGGIVNMLGVAHPTGPQLPISYDKLTPKTERIGKKLTNLGVRCIAILPKSVSNTPMSNFDDDGFSAVIPYYDPWDLRTVVEKELEKKEKKFVYVYVPYVDTLSHHYGPYSEESLSAAKDLIEFFEREADRARGYTLMGTADHGQVEVDPALPPPPELMSLLELPPYGDSRAMFLKTAEPERVIDYLEENFPDMIIMTREQVLKEGLLGKNETNYPERLGDLLVLPQSKRIFIYPYTENNESFNYRGHHGGLSPEEMRVPLLIRSRRSMRDRRTVNYPTLARNDFSPYSDGVKSTSIRSSGPRINTFLNARNSPTMKAVITAAGKGSRMSPSTKAIPKGLLPLFSNSQDKLIVVPIIQLILDELHGAGADDICLVVGEKKDPLITYLLEGGMKLTFVQQDPPLGFADAVAKAKEFVKGEPFFVHADDGVVYSPFRNPLNQMWDKVKEGADAALLVREVETAHQGGVILGKKVGDHIEVEDALEKVASPPSKLAITAVYAFSGRAMQYISSVGVGATGEMELTDAISKMAKEGRVIAIQLEKPHEAWLNVGNPEAYHAALELSYSLSTKNKAEGSRLLT